MLLLLPPAADEGICFVVERCCDCMLPFVVVVVVLAVVVTSLLFTALRSVMPK